MEVMTPEQLRGWIEEMGNISRLESGESNAPYPDKDMLAAIKKDAAIKNGIR